MSMTGSLKSNRYLMYMNRLQRANSESEIAAHIAPIHGELASGAGLGLAITLFSSIANQSQRNSNLPRLVGSAAHHQEWLASSSSWRPSMSTLFHDFR